ncbi:ABC transporter permease [Thalassospira australica]|uniref:ABC transporter permease n=1 Tax=Thalassospira australica TaxID=1528106 RepID=UPI0012E04E2B|nr:FtsX-like permease family protein [Thalassospira australica]
MSRPTSLLARYSIFPASLTIALRELRRPGVGMSALFATLVFAATILLLTVSLTQSVRDGMRQSAQQTIGGDISLRLFHRAPTSAEIAFLKTQGTVSLTLEQRVMVGSARDTPPVLSELKAIDQTYPLYGEISLTPDITLEDALMPENDLPGAVVGPELLEHGKFAIGDLILLGGRPHQIRAVITTEPERKFRLFSLGPRVIVGLDGYRENPLLAPGKQVYWYARLKVPAGKDRSHEQIIANIEDKFPDSGWRIVNAADGVPGMERIGDFASAFVSLIGLAIFAIAMSAIHNALIADLSARRRRFAIMRGLGARPHQIATSLIWQIGLITSVAVFVAILLTTVTGQFVFPYLRDQLGFDIRSDFTSAPLIVSFVYGFVTLVAIGPISTACLTPPSHLFRHQMPHQQGNDTFPKTRLWASRRGQNLVKVVLAIVLYGIATLLIDLGWLSLALLGVLVFCLLLFVLLGRIIRFCAGKLAVRSISSPTLRLALRNIARPAAPTVTITASFGLAMTCLFAVILFGTLAGHHLKSVLPSQTPEIIFFDLPPNEAKAFEERARQNADVRAVTQMPFLHGRVTHLNGTPLTRADVPRRYHWFLRGDRGISWTAAPTADMEQSTISDGHWWGPNSQNAHLASLDAGVAKAIGIAVGDRLTLNIFGHPYDVQVANLRIIDWTRLGLDFPLVLSPMDPSFDHGVLSAISLGDEASLNNAIDQLREGYPDIPAIIVSDVLGKLNGMFDAVLSGLVGLTVLATIGASLVIISGLIALRQSQSSTLAMLRTLGIQPVQITTTGALETGMMIGISGFIGLIMGAGIAIGAGQTIGTITAAQIAQVAWPILASAIVIMLVVGFGGGWALQARALRTRPGWRS